MSRLPPLLAAVSALVGALAVALAAAGAHFPQGGEFTRTAAVFLLLHAAAGLGISGGLLIASDTYTISAMDLWDIEVEPEVRAWLESLPKRQFGHVLAFAEKLAEEATTLGEPYSRHLGGKVRELWIRFTRWMRG